MTTNITESAMLSRLSVSLWTARRHDKRLSDEVATNHGAQSDAGRYNKLLLSKDALAETSKIASAAREFHYTNTLPWMDDGYRILPAANFWHYGEKMRAYHADFDSAVAKFLDGYPSFKADARVRLNGMFREDDYPDEQRIRAKFDFDVGTMPLPQAADFRVSLNDGEVARIKSEIEQRTQAAIDGAVRDLWQRIRATVEHIAERLELYRVSGGKVENPFRDSLIENARELVGLLPRLNVTGDPDLDRITREIDMKLCALDPQTLRESDVLRGKVAQDANAILEAMAGYCGG